MCHVKSKAAKTALKTPKAVSSAPKECTLTTVQVGVSHAIAHVQLVQDLLRETVELVPLTNSFRSTTTRVWMGM